MEPFRKHLNILTGLHSRSAEPPPGETGADHWVAAAFLCAQKPRKTAGADVYAGQTIDQIIAAQVRAGNAAAVGGDFGGRPGFGFEQLRRRLQLRLHQHDRLGVADHAVADGAEPAGGIRAHVRQRQHRRAARAAPRAQPEHPRFGQRQDQGCAQRDQRAGPCAPGCLHRQRARDRASPADRRQARRLPRRRISRCRRAFRSRSTSTSRSCSTCWRSASRPTSPASAPCCSRAISPAASIRKARRRRWDSTAARTTAKIRT